ncbi:hypothetical protein LCGC14_1900530 [marine sediment metagenome]|uniref:Uncharacterized protein n=1 Tax=marine sediment metagenome TaxID=412755 RepID=A0A0F9IUU7_9ZZZZ
MWWMVRVFQSFKSHKDNPGPQGTEPPPLEGDDPFVGMHSSLWKFLLHLDKRQAVTDERVLFLLRYIMPIIIGIELMILGYLIGG